MGLPIATARPLTAAAAFAALGADHGGSRCVRVEALCDLARLAQMNGGVVFSQGLPTGALYFVPDGAVMF